MIRKEMGSRTLRNIHGREMAKLSEGTSYLWSNRSTSTTIITIFLHSTNRQLQSFSSPKNMRLIWPRENVDQVWQRQSGIQMFLHSTRTLILVLFPSSFSISLSFFYINIFFLVSIWTTKYSTLMQ